MLLINFVLSSHCTVGRDILLQHNEIVNMRCTPVTLTGDDKHYQTCDILATEAETYI